ncbi:hypothetical protein [Saccharopolyspora griseoalba]|uniref:DUF3883 domain-containing protein n=1 Tax=Saccharopolyspora griseoalba TaxID=1431848 RepID=A0ABW2LGS9_9PSEU
MSRAEQLLTRGGFPAPAEVLGEAGALAAGPLAPVLAEALIGAARRETTGWWRAMAEFVEGLAGQRSLLALTGAIDELLAEPIAVREHGARLHDVLLGDLDDAVAARPLVASGRLEGAVRLALGDAVSPFAALAALTGFSPDVPEEFAERLPRLLGAAVDRWAGEPAIADPLRAALDRLRHDEAAGVDATFELGCVELRAALRATDGTAALDALAAARARFATVEAAEHARHDALAHGAACEAVLAFAARDRARLAEAADQLTGALDQRDAWSRGTHHSAWSRARRAAESSWRRLLALLLAAAERLTETVWMNVWEALGAVLDAYTRVRALPPLPGEREAPGLAAVVEPAVESGILRSRGLLDALRRAAAEASAADHPPIPARAAHALLDRVDAPIPEPREPREPREVAPPRAARSQIAHPVLDPLLEQLLGELAESPMFTGEVRETFGLLLEQTLRFLLSRADLSTRALGAPRRADYRRRLRDGEPRPHERELQQDFQQWLATGQLAGRVGTETADLAMGRADLVADFGSLRYATEVKRELRDASREAIEARHLRQAAEYGIGNAPFGQLLVLDLTPHPHGAPRVDESVWLARHRPPGAELERMVVVGIVAGNRRTPHELSARC